MSKRIGLSMRVTTAIHYIEPRDSISQNWWPFLHRLFDTKVMLLPNLGDSIVDYAEEWKLDGFILSGGDDVGLNPERDSTEIALLNHAVKNQFPLFGVCRGLQLINMHFGGTLTKLTDRTHANKRHFIRFDSSKNIFGIKEDSVEVNSYHNNIVCKHNLASALQPLAFATDGTVEALFHPTERLLACQWHPEREPNPSSTDLNILTSFFKGSRL
jgi:N5-(cytidine 5'-diphosphoramidyl)-L-glutamine hydrolase